MAATVILKEIDAVRAEIQRLDREQSDLEKKQSKETGDAWVRYDEQCARLEELKKELGEARLQGGTFRVHVAGAPAPQWLEIDWQSRLLFCSATQASSVEDLTRRELARREKREKGNESDVPDKEDLTVNIVRYIDQLARIVLVEAAAVKAAAAKSSKSKKKQQAPPPPELPGPSQLYQLTWIDDQVDELSVADSEEFYSMLGAHLTRFNHRKLYQVQRLTTLYEQRTTPFSPDTAAYCPHHDILLARLWDAGREALGRPRSPLCRVSHQWARMGFKSTDPSPDFHGTGILGLQQLVYFAEHFSQEFGCALRRQQYPFAVVALEVVRALADHIGLAERQVKTQWAGETGWSAVAIAFFSYVDHENGFTELVCNTLLVLDSLLDEQDESDEDERRKPHNHAIVERLPLLLAHTMDLVEEFFATHPTSLDDLHMWMCTITRTSSAPTTW